MTTSPNADRCFTPAPTSRGTKDTPSCATAIPSDGFFHFNWGWGGMCDGYFRLTALNPDAVGIGGGSGLGFNFYQDAILGIQPEATPARTPNLAQGGNLVLSLDGNVLYLSCENGVNNGFFNTTGATINGQIGIMLENQEGYTEYFWNT